MQDVGRRGMIDGGGEHGRRGGSWEEGLIRGALDSVSCEDSRD